MQTITKYLVLAVLCLNVHLINAQDTIPAIKNKKNIEMLERVKVTIKNEEREYLKKEVEAINLRLEKGEITNEEAQDLKQAAAKKHALNIENRIAIVDNKIALLKRNEKNYEADEDKEESKIAFTVDGEDGTFVGIKIKGKEKSKKFDKRTTSDLVLAFGLNNAIVEGETLDDSPYKFAGSRFFEIGMAWKWRVFENSNAVRLKYGFSFQMNGLKPTNNRYFISQNNQTVLEEFPHQLKKSKLTVSNLVMPVHFEFGPSKKIEEGDYIRYNTRKKFKIGIGGYAGVNIGTRQKLKYRVDGNRQKDKIRGGLNTSGLVYGLSSYVAVGGTALYVKYDLSPIFKDQNIKQNNISLGVRFDMD